jgi:hypothetical protein
VRWSDITFADRTIRQFAALCLVLVGGLALWHGLILENVIVAILLGVVALTIGPVGLLWPRCIRPLYALLMLAVFPLGWVISHGVLAVLYFGLFTPLAVVFRFRGRDALQRKFCPDQDSYWQERPRPETRRYFRQF